MTKTVLLMNAADCDSDGVIDTDDDDDNDTIPDECDADSCGELFGDAMASVWLTS